MKVTVAVPPADMGFAAEPTWALQSTFAVEDLASTIAQLCGIVPALWNVTVTFSPAVNVSVGPGEFMLEALFPNP